jgi:hypothetical protein
MTKVRPSNLFLRPWAFFCYEKKHHYLLPEIWSKAINKSIKRIKSFFSAELILNGAAHNGE